MSISKKILFSLLPAFFFFGLIECSLRLFYHPNRPFRFYAPHSRSIMEPDPDLGYRLRPNFSGSAYGSQVVVNRIGFRGPDFDPSKPNGLRIVALGDSCTFGFG